MTPLTVLVTGAGGPLGANVTRSLRRAPETLRLVGTDANRWHLPLALTDRTVRIPPARERDGYAAALAALVAEGVDVILPTHPVEVRAVAELAESGRLAPARVALPRLEVIARGDDKVATQRALDAAGVPVPRTILLEHAADVLRAFAELGPPPLWVRGSGAPGLGIGAAALPCADAGVAAAWVEHHGGWGRMAASELLPGRNLTWMAGFAHGRLLAAAARERLEYVLPHVAPSGITGAPAVSRTIREPGIAAIGEGAVRALDPEPHGVYFVDLKEDRAGAPRVTEINAGRCGTTVHFYTEAGFNFPWLLVCLAAGRAPTLPAVPNEAVPAGLYWLRTLDLGPVLVREADFDRFEVRPWIRSAVLFDLDGTLLHLEVDIETVRQKLAALFAPWGVVAPFRPILTRLRAAAAEAAARGGNPKSLLKEGFAILDAAELAAAAQARPRPGAPETVAALASRGVKLGLVTDNGRLAVTRALAAAGFTTSAFATIVTRDDVPAPKPDPAGLLLALKAVAGADPIWYVGDHPRDLGAARAANLKGAHLRVVGLKGGLGGDADLSSADATIAEPAGLLALLGIHAP